MTNGNEDDHGNDERERRRDLTDGNDDGQRPTMGESERDLPVERERVATVDESLRFLINYIRDSLRLKESKRYKQVIILLDWLFRDDETPVSPVEENTETPPDVTEESSEAPTADSDDNSTPGASALWKKLWAEQGDEVSLEYAGTHALKGDLVRFGKQTIGGMIKDGMSALARYYLDNFHDGDALDLISGRYFVNSNSLSPFQLNGFDVAYLPVASALVIGGLTVTTFTLNQDLGSQGLRGYISEQISLLTDLVTLNLSSNSLEGRLPSGLGHKSLTTLDLSNNQFTGSIPDSLTTSSLKLMILNGNLLEGRVPEQLYSIGVHGGEIEKCIYEKLSDEEVDSCPVCEIDLGCLPVEKLRPDHNLEDIRAKIFPYKRRKTETVSEVVPPISPPAKRKERSLSSLAVNAPKGSMKSELTGRRTKASARKAAALQECGYILDEPSMKEDSGEERSMSSGSVGSPKKSTKGKRQDSYYGDHSNKQRSNVDIENDIELVEGNADVWSPLNCLLEAANRTKSSKLNQGPSLGKSEIQNTHDSELVPKVKAKAESRDALDSETNVPKAKANSIKVMDENIGMNSLLGQAKRKKQRAADRKRAAASEELCGSAQVMLGTARANHHRQNTPIWFTLVASKDEDGKMPVSFIQKYIVKKLDLASEAEVEIMCRGQSVLPTLQLHDLVDLWLRTASTTKRVPASVGGSAKDFVMVLSYCRKVVKI
ncbi:hypothetical protein ACFE04_023916 [Oxalis oulophora]